jgi:hypothetical protein
MEHEAFTSLLLAKELGKTSMQLQDTYNLLRKKENELQLSEIQLSLLKNLYEKSKIV